MTPNTSRGAAPAWTKYPTTSPFSNPNQRKAIPKSWLAYNEAEDRAYHRVNGLEWRKRVRPRIPESGTHPDGYKSTAPSRGTRVRSLRGQLSAIR